MYSIVRKKDSRTHMVQNQYKETEYLTFPGLGRLDGVRHLFSTRIGGVSEGMYASMNLSFTRGDNVDSVFQNFDRIGEILGASREQFVLTQQTHTDHIRIVTKADAGRGLTKPLGWENVDGLITNESGLVLSAFFADCVPIYLVDPVKHVIGLCHSGWRGTVQKIGAKTVRLMQETYGCNPAELHGGIAPSICQDCYEVSKDVIDEIERNFCEPEALFYQTENGKYKLNLWKACEETLLEAGLQPENIEITDICTCCNPTYLFSHRASKGRRGNLGAFLMLED